MTASLHTRAIAFIFDVCLCASARAAVECIPINLSAAVRTRHPCPRSSLRHPAAHRLLSRQSASIQTRNSAGLRLPSGKLLLVTLVDTAGYSSALQQTHQAYLLTELPILLGGQRLSPGAYGFGFVPGNKLVVLDLGGNPLF